MTSNRESRKSFQFQLIDSTAKCHQIMSKYEGKKVYVAYSGGSDSDTTMFFLRQCGYSVPAVMYDTGIEWRATYQHVERMRGLGFDIEVIRAKTPVPTSNRKYGHPFISKRVSDYLQRLQKHSFDFQGDGKKSFDELFAKYPKAKVGLRWWCNDWGEQSRFNISYNKWLKEFLTEYGLPFRVSAKCCDGAKKLPVKQFTRERGVDLMVLGIRKTEGGSRAGAYSACFVPKKSYTYDMYFPLFWWKNDMKQWYDTTHDIQHSDCYGKYGLKRTGCAGCPFGLNPEHELAALDQYEPQLGKGIKNIFAPSYEWTKKYREFCHEMNQQHHSST